LSLDYPRVDPVCGHNGDSNIAAEDESDRD
jgi:hypothetical protein